MNINLVVRFCKYVAYNLFVSYQQKFVSCGGLRDTTVKRMMLLNNIADENSTEENRKNVFTR
jgi:hypothetical protein